MSTKSHAQRQMRQNKQIRTPSSHTDTGELFELLSNASVKTESKRRAEETDTLYIANHEGDKVPLIPDMYAPLETMVRAFIDHKTVKIVAQDRMMTTQEAADYLGVSRPTLVRLLEEGKIPFEKLKKHRRVAFADVENYRVHHEQSRRKLTH